MVEAVAAIASAGYAITALLIELPENRRPALFFFHVFWGAALYGAAFILVNLGLASRGGGAGEWSGFFAIIGGLFAGLALLGAILVLKLAKVRPSKKGWIAGAVYFVVAVVLISIMASHWNWW